MDLSFLLLQVISMPSVLSKIHGPYCCRITKAAWREELQVGHNTFKDLCLMMATKTKKEWQERCVDEGLKAGEV